MSSRRAPAATLGLLAALAPASASAAGVDAAPLLRALGPRAQAVFAPGAPGMGALVRLPAGASAASLGLSEVAPGIGRLYGSAGALLAYADAHPGLALEIAPPLHTLLDKATDYVRARDAIAAGLDGTGVAVGIADTGIDVTHADFLDAQGHSRIAWLLDLSAPPRGQYADLEKQFGTTDDEGHVVSGAVWAAADLDAAMASGPASALPQDEVGHGTLVASCAAGNGEQGRSIYRGVAPGATVVAARVAAAGTESIGNDELLRGTAFLFDRAGALGVPVVVNLSIGSDFGPHDGTMAWEETLASYVGDAHPGRALVVAAGNSGSIVDTPVHQSVRVSPGATMRVPIGTPGALDGGVEVWVALHGSAELSVGLDGPDGTWIDPVGPGGSGAKSTSAYQSGIYNGPGPSGSPVPAQSHGAVIAWQGSWPGGVYTITLQGEGTADLYVEGSGDVGAQGEIGFFDGVREGTVNLPATSPGLIGVGCSINKPAWMDLAEAALGLDAGVRVAAPALDPYGGLPAPGGGTTAIASGEPCWFSSAGPTLDGRQKPEILAPGGAIVGAMSAQAAPGTSASLFTNPSCPPLPGGAPDPKCMQIDATHAAAFGTSFSAPIVAGAVAAMLQHDPSLTQPQILAALQGGAHPLRSPAEFSDQGGPGEVDVLGAVEAIDRLRSPALALPDPAGSWLTPGADVLLADGSTPLQAIVELRAATAPGGTAAPPADGFAAGRLAVYAQVDGEDAAGAVQSLVRRGPGVWVATIQLPAGLGGEHVTIGATFDGAEVVSPATIPIATDAWTAGYAGSVKGGCAIGESRTAPGGGLVVALGLAGAARRGRRQRAGTTRGAPPRSPGTERSSAVAGSSARRK